MRFDKLIELTRRSFVGLLELFKPVAAIAVVMWLLQTTGLMNSVTDAGQWAILHSGLKDAGDVAGSDERFDFLFNIKDLEGNKIPFDRFKGRVVFLNIWATWCGPCRAEMAGIQELYNKIHKEAKGNDKSIAFVMLSIDRDGDQRKVSDYLQKKKFTFPAFMPSGYLPSQLQVKLIPTTFIISREGKVVRKEIGSTQFDTPKFKKFLQELDQ